jgi:hypothetical protein
LLPGLVAARLVLLRGGGLGVSGAAERRAGEREAEHHAETHQQPIQGSFSFEVGTPQQRTSIELKDTNIINANSAILRQRGARFNRSTRAAA